ncbi:MAG: hypothetical protein K2K28_02580 [Clostridia bacterium]|nr:hypothetical protein [Clostridia bacterium]
MKKLVISMVAVVSAIIMCFALAGCSKDVKGNTYVFSDVKITAENDSLTQEQIDAAANGIKEMYGEMTISFKDDGTFVMTMGEHQETGNYKQDGDKVYLDDETDVYLEVSGSKISMTMSEDGMKATIEFKKK